MSSSGKNGLNELKKKRRNIVKDVYAIESQTDFFIECEIKTELGYNIDVYWWFKSNNSHLKILKRPKIDDKIVENDDNSRNNKMTIVHRLPIDCPSIKNEGKYYCAAVSDKFYHKAEINLKVLGKLKCFCVFIEYFFKKPQ
jgi:hypothetical protein